MTTNTRSILRYPGSKARLASFISKTIKLNSQEGELFVEPFCGGSSVSIYLLEENVVGEIALNDMDPLVASLWDVIFSPRHASRLAAEVLTIPLTISEWKRQKALKPNSRYQAALKCLYLNRTSFNGILHQAGPLGGWKQEKRTVGARFNRERLAERIMELSTLSPYVYTVDNRDWVSFCSRIRRRRGVVFYFDPPFYHKADQLYGHVFDIDDHYELAEFLEDFNATWMLSYDDTPEIRHLYKPVDLNSRVIDSTYSAHPMGGASFVGKELFYSNINRLPSPERQDKKHSGLTVRRSGRSTEHGDGPIRIPTFV